MLLRHLGIEGTPIDDGIQLHVAAMMRRATIAGTGVGLLSMLDAAEDIRAGLVVAPFGVDALAGMAVDQVPGFYLLVPRSRRRLNSVAAFCDWVTSEDWAIQSQRQGKEADATVS
jgi:LysR family transcriptional regulator, glycine cleavage system transcriptional activator